MITIIIFTIMAVFCFSPTKNVEAAPPPLQWQLEAMTDVIVVGRLSIEGTKVDLSTLPRGEHLIPIEITVLELLKGTPRSPIVFPLLVCPHCSKEYRTAPILRTLQSQSTQAYLIFLQEPSPQQSRYYLSDNWKTGVASLLPATVENIAATQLLIKQHQQLLHTPLPTHPIFDARVGQLITQALSASYNSEHQHQAFRSLVSLGWRGVPALITHLDDRRRFKGGSAALSLPSTDGFEGIVHYGPGTVLEALSSVLGEITDEGFDCPTNAEQGNPLSWQHCVNGWRLYYHHHYARVAFPPKTGLIKTTQRSGVTPSRQQESDR